MKRLTILLFVFIPFIANAQTAVPIVQGSKYYQFRNAVRMDSALFIPRKDTIIYDATLRAPSMLTGRPQDSLLYYYTGSKWLKMITDLDTTSLSSRIDQKLNISDTLDMLSSYLRKVDTTGKWKPLSWFPGVSEVTGLQDSLSDRFTKDQSDSRYLQGNQTITLSGDVLGSGTTAISTTLKNTGTAGTYTKVTTDAQGRVTAGTQLAAGDIPNLSSTYIPLTQKGAANGVASLGSDGKVPSSQLPTTGSLYQGTWNASTNTPTIADGVGTAGWYYRVSTGGTQDLGSGDITFNAGDDVIYNGSIWQRVPAASAVSSVNGMTGDVVIDKDDVGLGSVDNTSDLAKPISTATQTALNGKEPTIAPGTTAQYWRGDKTWQTLSTAVRPLFSAGTGLTYNSSTGAFAANFGTTAGTVMQGNDSRVTGAVPNTRTLTAGSGLTGGGNLTVDRSFAIDPAYDSFTNYYTKTNLQTSGQAAVHWGNLTNVPGAFPTTSNLQTVLGNGNTATNSITLGVNGNSTAYLYNVIRRISSTDYTSTVTTGVPPGGGAAAQLAISDGTTTKSLYVRHADAAPTYTPDGTNLYTLWHSNNHPAGSAFTPTLTGANVLSSLTVNSAGHVSALTTRTLTSGDIGAVPAGTVTTSYSDMLGSLTPRFITAVTGAPSSGTWYGIHMPGDASNSAQIAFKNGSGFFRTYDAGVASSWIQFADRSWVTSNFAASGSYVNLQGSTPGTAQTGHINISGTLTASAVASPSGGDLSISAPASHSLFFNPGGTNRGVWDGDGRLGIGVVPNSLRASLLEVNGNVWATDAYILGTTNSPTAEFGLQGGGTNGSAFLRTMGTGNLDIQTGASNTRIQVNGTTGNVGIGTAATAYNLTVAGDVSFAGNNFTVNALGQTVVGGTLSADGEITANGGLEIGTFGQLTIPQGAGTGKVLTSDVSGNASWQVPGQKMNVTARQAGNYTVGASDQVVLLNPSTSGFTLTLPTAASSTGRVLWVRNLNTGTTPVNSSISIIGEGGTITAFPAQLTLQIISDGTDWIQIGK